MWCLARLLPLMIGEYVAEDDDRWGLFTKFLMILNYTLAPSINEEIIEYLRKLIEDHHSRFFELYPNCSIIPKQHYMIHFPDWMKK